MIEVGSPEGVYLHRDRPDDGPHRGNSETMTTLEMKLFTYAMIGAFACGLLMIVVGSANAVMGF